jgi:hypothetical protein
MKYNNTTHWVLFQSILLTFGILSFLSCSKKSSSSPNANVQSGTDYSNYTLTVTSGGSDTAVANGVLSPALTLQAFDPNKVLAPGVPINWSCDASACTFANAASGAPANSYLMQTDANGAASPGNVTSLAAAAYTVTASIPGTSVSQTFPVSAPQAGTCTTNPVATIATPYPSPAASYVADTSVTFAAKAEDSTGTCVSGASLTFYSAEGTAAAMAIGTAAASTVATTGVATSAALKLGAANKTYQITAKSGTVQSSPLSFTVVAADPTTKCSAGPVTQLTLEPPSGAVYTAGKTATFVVTLLDASGTCVAKADTVKVVASVVPTSSTGNLTDSPKTSATTGKASAKLVLGAAGTAYSVKATDGSIASNPLSITVASRTAPTATAITAVGPANVKVVAGASIGTAVGEATSHIVLSTTSGLQAKVLNGKSVVGGAAVSWKIPGASAVSTTADSKTGIATLPLSNLSPWNTAGTYTVQASVTGLSSVKPASFTFHVVAGAVDLTKSVINPSVSTSQATAVILDQYSNPVPKQGVTFYAVLGSSLPTTCQGLTSAQIAATSSIITPDATGKAVWSNPSIGSASYLCAIVGTLVGTATPSTVPLSPVTIVPAGTSASPTLTCSPLSTTSFTGANGQQIGPFSASVAFNGAAASVVPEITFSILASASTPGTLSVDHVDLNPPSVTSGSTMLRPVQAGTFTVQASATGASPSSCTFSPVTVATMIDATTSWVTASFDSTASSNNVVAYMVDTAGNPITSSVNYSVQAYYSASGALPAVADISSSMTKLGSPVQINTNTDGPGFATISIPTVTPITSTSGFAAQVFSSDQTTVLYSFAPVMFSLVGTWLQAGSSSAAKAALSQFTACGTTSSCWDSTNLLLNVSESVMGGAGQIRPNKVIEFYLAPSAAQEDPPAENPPTGAVLICSASSDATGTAACATANTAAGRSMLSSLVTCSSVGTAGTAEFIVNVYDATDQIYLNSSDPIALNLATYCTP